MDLYSAKDKILLKNCILVKLQQLQLEKNKENTDHSSIADEINYYKKFLEILINDNTDLLISVLNNSNQNQKYLDFCNHILNTPAKDLANENIDLIKSLMIENNVYTDKKFEDLIQAFYKGNEDMITTSSYSSLEEEPENIKNINYLNDDINKCLSDFEVLFNNSKSHSMNSDQFKEFSKKFKELTKNLCYLKLKQYYDEHNKKIKNMDIKNNIRNKKPIYEIILTLEDEHQNQFTKEISGRAYNTGFPNTYYQSLCYSYLEAEKYSNLDTTLIDKNIIETKMASFKKCYNDHFKNMAKYKFNETFIPNTESADTPSIDLEISSKDFTNEK